VAWSTPVLLSTPAAAQASASALSWQLSVDWVDAVTSFGPWTIENGGAAMGSVADWDPGGSSLFDTAQPAYAAAAMPAAGHVPMWAKLVAGGVRNGNWDALDGDVISHGFGAVTRTAAVWTSPVATTVTVTATVWAPLAEAPHDTRSELWELRLNGVVQASGTMNRATATRATAVVTTMPLAVAIGDTIDLAHVAGALSTETFLGVDLLITT
jgi:hypothetical protein